MKTKAFFIISLVSGFCRADCLVEDALKSLRPQAQWVMTGDSYSTLQWLDKVQLEPTQQDVEQYVADCKSAPAPASLEDRVAALETAVTAVAAQTNVSISLPVQASPPVKVTQ